ncbi:ABC transporter ATP-binding protein [Candidatus Woesearchaeota archaeon]|nr:ABC transporter ATP-binding protein [Candidatus Woesearchaeota archaeon]
MVSKKEAGDSSKPKADTAAGNAGASQKSRSYMTGKQPLILVKNISKSYRNKLVLRDISFDIYPKDVFGIIGMSGSGKTTLFQLMAGILNVNSGDILIKRELLYPPKKDDAHEQPYHVSVFRNQSAIRRKFGFASQMPSFYEHLTVNENLHFYAALHNIPKKKAKESAEKLLKLVQLTDEADTVAAELSGGMQRRLDIACSLVHEPEVLFLDEPTSDLDPVMRKQIWALIQSINDEGTTIVLSSHIIEEVERLCSKVAIIHDKRLLGAGSLDELKGLFKKSQQVRVELSSGKYDVLLKRLRKEKSVERIVLKENRLVIFVPPDEKTIRRIIRIVESGKDRLVSLDISDATLSEIFEALARRPV